MGRVNALGDSLAWAGIPLGGLLGGAAVAAFGLVPALLTGGIAFFLTTNLAGLRPEWRHMDRLRSRPEPATKSDQPGVDHPEQEPTHRMTGGMNDTVPPP